jgi:hypothetical protein
MFVHKNPELFLPKLLNLYNIPQTSQNTLAVSCVLCLHQPFALQNPPLEESQGAVEPREISAFMSGNIVNEPNNQSPDYEVCQDWYNKVQQD